MELQFGFGKTTPVSERLIHSCLTLIISRLITGKLLNLKLTFTHLRLASKNETVDLDM